MHTRVLKNKISKDLNVVFVPVETQVYVWKGPLTDIDLAKRIIQTDMKLKEAEEANTIEKTLSRSAEFLHHELTLTKSENPSRAV